MTSSGDPNSPQTSGGGGPRPGAGSVAFVGVPSPLPVLDMSRFRVGADDEFVADLRRTCHEIGFFYLAGHGIDEALNERVLEVARAFFALPEADRLAIENVHSPQFRGYTRVGEERTNGERDWRDQLDIGRELPPPALGPDDPVWLRLRGPNLWPAALPELRAVVLPWMAELEALGRRLLQGIALALGQPADHFDPTVTPRPEVLVKVIRYPGGRGDQGVGAHRDTGFLTFLLQDATGGLQVGGPDGFLDVPKIPGTFVINLGEMLQIATHGYLKATVHRVVSPPGGVERISVPYFFNPKLEATLEPVVLPPELAAEATGGESADASNPIFANYGENSMKVRLRAHPNVAERHHTDLLSR